MQRLAWRITAEWFGGEVQVHAPRKSVSDDQRRRSQIIGANQRMNAALKVAIAAEDGHGDQIVVLDRGADGLRQRTAVAKCKWCTHSQLGESSVSLDKVSTRQRASRLSRLA